MTMALPRPSRLLLRRLVHGCRLHRLPAAALAIEPSDPSPPSARWLARWPVSPVAHVRALHDPASANTDAALHRDLHRMPLVAQDPEVDAALFVAAGTSFSAGSIPVLILNGRARSIH